MLPVDEPPVAALAADLRFGDVIAIADQDHRYLRAPRAGWVAIGVVCHGRSVGGGHGFGMVTLLSGPMERDLRRCCPLMRGSISWCGCRGWRHQRTAA